jgi:hypothetical protein
MTPSGAAPGKAQAPVLPRAVTKPGVFDRPATSAATGRSASGSKRDKIEATNDGDERSEESAASKTRRAQRATDATRGADDDARSSRKRGLENIGRMLEAMHRMSRTSLHAGDERAARPPRHLAHYAPYAALSMKYLQR